MEGKTRKGHGGNWQLQLDVPLHLFAKWFIALYETMHSCHVNSQLFTGTMRTGYYHIL